MVETKSPISLKESATFLNDIKDVPIPTLLIGLGFILIISGWVVSKITGNNELLSAGIIFAVFGVAAYQNKRTKTSKKNKRKT
jgi:uncharacterized membrane protein